MATNWLVVLKAYVDTLETIVGTEGGVSLANKLTTARAALLNQITALRMAELDAGNIPTDLANIIAYVDLIDDVTNGLAAIKAEVEGLAGAAMRGTDNAALAASWTAALATALGNYTAARAGYLDNINQAGLLQITAARAALLDQITAARLAELDAANIPADVDTLLARLTALRAGYLDNLSGGAVALAASWTAALATALGSYTAARAAYLDNINQAGLLQVTAARAALLDQITALRLAELDAANLPADVDLIKGYTDSLEGAIGAIEGATTLHNKLTAARALLLEQITAVRLAELDAANLPADVDTLLTRLSALRAGYLDNLSAGAVALAATALSTAQWTNALATALGNYTAARAGYLDNINQAGLLQVTAARAALLDQITAARLAELDAANIPTDLANIIAYVDELETRLSAVRAAYLDNINQAGLLQITAARAGYLDNLAPTTVGKLQIKATTIDLNQAAATYVLFTANAQDVVVEKLVIRMSGGAIAGAFTYLTIQTDDVTPIVLINATQGDVANLGNEAQLAYIGAILLDAGTAAKIRLTIAVAQGGAARVCDVIAECRAVVAGGYLT